MIGADVDALERLAGQFGQAAERLRHHAGGVSDGIGVSAWLGPVAVRFKMAWDSIHSLQLLHAADVLDASARVLRQNAAEQQAASSSLQGVAGASVVVRGGDESGSVSAERIAPQDFLDLAKSSDGGALPPGWHYLTGDELRHIGIDPAELNTTRGMNAAIAVDGSGRYVLIFEGSSQDDGNADWIRENSRSGAQSGAVGGAIAQGTADVADIIDPGSSTEEAMNLALKLKNAVGSDHLSSTGWSLGGRHAAAASVVTGCDAVTFNAAGVTNNDRLYARTLLGDDVSFGEYALGRMGVEVAVDDSHIINFRATGDPLTLVQSVTSASDAGGRQVDVPGLGHILDQFDGKI